MDYKLEDLIDVSLLQNLQEKLNSVYSFPSAIIDNDGKVLTAVAWQDICTKFHRVNPQSEKECVKSDLYIVERILEAEPSLSYKCPHGLIENATPIIIDGSHLGVFLTGQFLMEKPDLTFFRKQAKFFGYDEEKYIEAVLKVPVWTKEKLALYIEFIKGFVEIVAGIGAKQLRELELNKVLKEKEYRYQTIIDTSSDGFCITDQKGMVTDVNDTYCNMTGFSRAELLKMHISELEANESEEEIQNHMREIMEKGNARFESKHRRKGKSDFDVELSIHYDSLNGGQFVAFVHDISERKKAENMLRESEERFRLITENTSDTITVVDFDLNFIYVSPSVGKLRGFTYKEAIKQKVEDIMTPDSYRKVMELYKNNISKIYSGETKDFPTVELEEYCKNGSTIWVELSFALLKDANGKPTGIITVTRDITDRKKSEKTLHDIIEKNPMSIQIVDKNGCSLSVNSAYTALFGAVQPQDFSMFKNLEERGFGEYILQAKSGKEVHFPDVCYNVHDISPEFPDNPTWIRSLIFPLNDSDGNPERFVIMHENVNDAKMAEQRLEKQLYYTTALNQIAEVINTSDTPDEILSEANRIVGETLKADRSLIYDISFNRKRVIGLCEWIREGHPEIEHTKGVYSLELFEIPFTKILESKTYLTSQSNEINEYFTKDGSGKLLHEDFMIKSLIWYPLAFDEHGFYSFTINHILEHRVWIKEEIDFLESVAKQVSLALMKIRLLIERKEAEDAFHYNHNLLLKLSNQVPGVIYQYRLYKDGSSKFPYSSNGMNDIYEYSPDEVKEDATPVFGRIHPEDLERVSQLIFESARTLELFVCEFRVILPRQGLRWRYSSAVPERMEDGSTLWHGIIYDITDRKMTEIELRKAKEKAEESDRLKSAFLANMSHEIRTPMNGILGFAQLLKEPKLSGKEQREYIDVIAKSGKRMLNVINDILDIAKIESGLMKMYIKKTNINKQIDYLCTFFKPEIVEKGMELESVCTLSDSEATIDSDREKIYAILTNLVKNAIKYSDHGKISIGYEKKGKYLEFFVKDTGLGIAANRHKAIFERFVQADLSDARALQGAGLGLTITKAYIEMLGGEIWLESEEGKGSTFYFTIPYILSADDSMSIKLDRTKEKESGLKNLNILIAEDDEDCILLLQNYLKKYSKVLLTAKDGSEAVAKCRDNPEIDLIMMDIKMPVMDGYDATKEIRKFNKDVIIIAQTAFALAGDMEKSINAGCNEYITKPINRVKLNELILKFFGGEHRKSRHD